MSKEINRAILGLTRRAEANDPSQLVSTFVDVGNLFALLSSRDHQVLYGRRGTGKTHALNYLANAVRTNGDLAVYVDMRTVGSSGGLYADRDVPYGERGTRLLVDTVEQVYSALVDAILEADYASDGGFEAAMRSAEALGASITDIRVSDDSESEIKFAASARDTERTDAGIAVGPAPSLSLRSGGEDVREQAVEARYLVRGPVSHRVHFGAVSKAMAQLVANLKGNRVWLLLDEWSDVPLDLQPLLADLIRRCLLPVSNLVVKIGAIEQRSAFSVPSDSGGYVGLELGADIAADIELDDFMVFGNDPERAKAFFADLLFRHVSAIMVENDVAPLASADELIQQGFTQRNAFDEFVRAAEGVPRDAIQVAILAAQIAQNDPISVPVIRNAARKWYLRDKEKAVEANPDAMDLLHWIMDEVISGRRARAFLLQQGEERRHPLIGDLYDSRVLHVVKKSVAAHDQPGVRFHVFGLDYGCYVELMTTANAPQGLLATDDATFVEVPPDDYRSIRRAILDLNDFDAARNAGGI